MTSKEEFKDRYKKLNQTLSDRRDKVLDDIITKRHANNGVSTTEINNLHVALEVINTDLNNLFHAYEDYKFYPDDKTKEKYLTNLLEYYDFGGGSRNRKSRRIKTRNRRKTNRRKTNRRYR